MASPEAADDKNERPSFASAPASERVEPVEPPIRPEPVRASAKNEAPEEDGDAGSSKGDVIEAKAEASKAPSTSVKKTSKADLDYKAMKNGPDLKAMVHRDVVVGSAIAGAFLVFLFAWSTLAPLSSAAIAPGVISPEGSRKTVQHLEGGIIEKTEISRRKWTRESARITEMGSRS